MEIHPFNKERLMTYKINKIEGIGPAYAEKLAAANISTTDELLTKCCTPAGRKFVAATTGMSETVILKWTNMADLMRINGIGPQFSELLKGSGVDTIKELRTRNAANLATKMAEVNEEKNLARVSPPKATIEQWVEAAKGLAPKLTY